MRAKPPPRRKHVWSIRTKLQTHPPFRGSSDRASTKRRIRLTDPPHRLYRRRHAGRLIVVEATVSAMIGTMLRRLGLTRVLSYIVRPAPAALRPKMIVLRAPSIRAWPDLSYPTRLPSTTEPIARWTQTKRSRGDGQGISLCVSGASKKGKRERHCTDHRTKVTFFHGFLCGTESEPQRLSGLVHHGRGDSTRSPLTYRFQTERLLNVT
jgi:hypothetical protein